MHLHETACHANLFRRVRKIAKSDDLAQSSVRMEQLGTHRTDFHEIWYFSIFFLSKICPKNSSFIKIGQD
jgi:hypothetical protein